MEIDYQKLSLKYEKVITVKYFSMVVWLVFLMKVMTSIQSSKEQQDGSRGGSPKGALVWWKTKMFSNLYILILFYIIQLLTPAPSSGTSTPNINSGLVRLPFNTCFVIFTISYFYLTLAWYIDFTRVASEYDGQSL